MKILKLQIENVRGIRDEILLETNGENAVIFGPNGTGKSAVVDAMDFLLKGEISRLSGRGSRDLKLKKHGPHIDSLPKDAFVRAVIQVDGIADPFEIERHMSDPKTLTIPAGIDETILNEVLEIAGKGQHVLSRAEILQFIAAEAGKRSDEIQALLDLSKAEELRKLFGNIKREADRNLQATTAGLEKSKSQVIINAEIKEFSENEVLKKVNAFRATLKGKPIDALDTEKLQEGISPKTTDKKDRVYPEQLKNNIKAIDELIAKEGQKVFDSEKELRETVKKLKEDEKLLRDLKSKRLIDIGITLIDDSGACPLCLSEWKPGELMTLLEERVSKAKEAHEVGENIGKISTVIDTEVTKLKGHIDSVNEDMKKLKQDDIVEGLEGWSKVLDEWSKTLRKAVDDYAVDKPTDDVKSFYIGEAWKGLNESLVKIADQLEKSTPEQKAWDALTSLKVALERYFADKKSKEELEKFSGIAGTLSTTYTATKDDVLQNLYQSVNTDFCEYYKALHGDDENGFSSYMTSDGAKLDLKVDFYGRGKHHPRALHSEGHQDSMGLCLYLALNNKISQGKVNLVILDDVVMSIDSNHRRSICDLLIKHFPDKQFIITTHNRTWARQLKTDGVVKSANMCEFKGWNVDTGPRFKEREDVWDEIKAKVDENEIASAAHKLREHLEFFFENVCDSLGAPVEYKSDARYEFGDYLNGAKKAYKDLLNKAKRSSSSWGKDVTEFNEIETQVNETIQRTQMEHWGINENVHYSKWADFEANDFLPIVEAFQDFEGYFKCSACGGLIKVSKQGLVKTDVRCSCNTISWNLIKKE